MRKNPERKTQLKEIFLGFTLVEKAFESVREATRYNIFDVITRKTIFHGSIIKTSTKYYTT